jgi:hypothetical protein
MSWLIPALLCATSAVAQTVEPVAAYSFDQGSGTVVSDASGNGHTVDLVNGPTWTAGRYGSALTFDGSNDRGVVRVYDAALDLPAALTLSAWIRPRTRAWQMIVNKPYANGHNPPYFDWSMHLEGSSGRVVLFIACDSVQRRGNRAVPLNTWTHVAVTYDGSVLRHYFNGVLDRTTQVGCQVTNANSRQVRIAANGANGEVFNGSLDDVRIYDRVLTAAEIQQDMNTGIGGGSSPPPDTTAPTVAITAPANGSTVSGTVSLTAAASDDTGVAGVQFRLDGDALGAEDVSAAFGIAWNTTTAAEGTHVLTAVARDAAGNSRTSDAVTVDVENAVPAPTLGVTLAASPASGFAPLNGVDLTAQVSGTATGPITYTYYCNRSDGGTNVTQPSDREASGVTPATHTATDACSYASDGAYSAKVIVQRGSLAAESRRTVTVTAPQAPAPTVALSASPGQVASGGSSNLTWSSTDATDCTASDAWSGPRSTAGSESTGPLTAPINRFTLSCGGAGGSASRSVTVTVDGAADERGLDFRGNASSEDTVRFRFTNPLAIYPATYIWKLKPRRQAGYYTTFFWGNDGNFTWSTEGTYYGAHPYPDPPQDGTDHKWEIAVAFRDVESAEHVTYDVWHTQALRVWGDASGKHHEFYWDLPNMDRVIRHTEPASYGNVMPPRPALTFGDAPWNPSDEILSGVLRGIQIYSTALSVPDILAEIANPTSTAAGASNLWYMNLNPTPADISDKSGKGHHPQWVGSERPLLWSGD